MRSRGENFKHQTSNIKETSSLKLQRSAGTPLEACFLRLLWSLKFEVWSFRGRALTLALLLTLPASAPACRYNIREIGFVDVDQPKFRLAVFVHGDEQKEWLPQFHQSATRLLGPSNVSWDIVDEVQQTGSPDLRQRAQLGPRLPGGMVLSAGRDDGWPVFLHVPPGELNSKLSALVSSPVRTQIINAVIETYGTVLLLRCMDETANAAARVTATDAIKAVEASLAGLPKRIEHGPRLVECDPSLPDEQIVAWSAGVNGKDLMRPVIAVIYGRGRFAGPPLQGATLTFDKLRDQLSLIGADCECTLDHGWMTAPSLPLVLTSADESRIAASLGFDPSAASVKAEVHQILQTQSQVALNPAARAGAGYRETPLEIVPIAPGLPSAVPADATAPDDPFPLKWRIAALAAASILALAALRFIARRSRS
jgi:hypothetical protein